MTTKEFSEWFSTADCNGKWGNSMSNFIAESAALEAWQARDAIDAKQKVATIKTDNTQVIINMQKQIDGLVEALQEIAQGRKYDDTHETGYLHDIAIKALAKHQKKGD